MSSHRWVSLDELQRRREEWHDLAIHSSFATAYGDPGWVLPWCEAYRETATPWCLALEDDEGRLEGLALLALRRTRLARTLCFLGSPWNGIDALPCRPEAEAELAERLLSALAERSEEWDLWRIRRLPIETGLARRLLSGDAPLSARAHDLRLQPYLELPGDEADFEANLSAKQRQRRRRRWRQLVNAGISPVSITDPAIAAEAMHALFELRRDRSKALGQSHRHLDGRFERFLTSAVLELLPGSARLWALRDAAGANVAICLTLVAAEREHGYMIAYDERHADLSPGHVLKRHVVFQAIAEGRREFELGPGRDESKYSMGAVDRTLSKVVVGSPSWRGRLTGAAAGLDLRARDTSIAERWRQRAGMTPERANSRVGAH